MKTENPLLESKIMTLITEISEEIGNIVITIPATIKWEDYQKELDLVKDYSNVMNFKVPNLPKLTNAGNKCYLCYNGNVIGWMEIVGMETKEFTCSTTGKPFKGKFVVRSGPFNKITPIKMKGFQGFRYFSEK